MSDWALVVLGTIGFVLLFIPLYKVFTILSTDKEPQVQQDTAATQPIVITAPAPDPAAVKLAEQKAECKNLLPQQLASYATYMKERKYWDAAFQIRACAELLAEPKLVALLKDAEVKSHLAEINDAKTPLPVKVRAMEMLARDYPDVGSKYKSEIPKLLAAEEKRIAAEEARLKRSRGVVLGMSKDDVLASSWGKPDHISRTSSVIGTTEVWIYGLSSILYFQNGKLFMIQN